MKKLFVTLLTLVCITVCTNAQENKSGNYLFEQFQSAKVIYKDGKVYQVDLNYDFMNGNFVFMDEHDNNEIKLFAAPLNIAAIQVEDRIFLATKNGATEVIQNNPPIHVQYKGKVRLQDKRVGYGGTSATASVQSYSGFISGGRWHQLEGEGSILAGISKKFTINKDGKKIIRKSKTVFENIPGKEGGIN